MFYLQILLILILFATLDIDFKFNANSRNLILFFLFIIFWLVAGLRYETGVDWLGYTKFYTKIGSLTRILGGEIAILKNSEFEIGYTLLNVIFKVFTDNVQLLFLIIAFFTNVMLFSSLKHFSGHLFVSLMIYFCTMYFVLDMDAIRQCIALNLFLYSLNFIIEKKILKYFIIILFASLFHRTALLLLPMYFFLNREFKNSTILIIVVVVLTISLFQIHWLRFFIVHLIDILHSGSFAVKLASSLNHGYSRNFGIGFIGNLLILILCLAKRKKLKENMFFNVFLNMYVINLVLYYSTWELSILSSRFRLYFIIGNAILLTYFIDLYRDKLMKYLIFIFIIFYCFFYSRIYLFKYSEGISYNPYQNYLVYKVFDLNSTGHERLKMYMRTVDKKQL